MRGFIIRKETLKPHQYFSLSNWVIIPSKHVMYFGFVNSQVKINISTIGTQELRTSSKTICIQKMIWYMMTWYNDICFFAQTNMDSTWFSEFFTVYLVFFLYVNTLYFFITIINTHILSKECNKFTKTNTLIYLFVCEFHEYT